jgi:sodium-dependent phosphate cotransporter
VIYIAFLIFNFAYLEMGSSLMNVLISMGQSGNRDQFRRAFAAASINDAFNLMNYLTVLPLEVSFNVLGKCAAF